MAIKMNAHVVDQLLFYNRSLNVADSDFKFIVILLIGTLKDISYIMNTIDKHIYEFINLLFNFRVDYNAERMKSFFQLIPRALGAAKKIRFTAQSKYACLRSSPK